MNGVVWLGIALLVAWLALLVGFHVTNSAIHLLAIVAVLIIVLGLTSRDDRPPDRET